MKLSELAIGASAVVRDFPKTGPAFVRLREMGLLTGTRVTLVRTAPLGDPLEAEAEHVIVELAG
jgi:ferrous iron transport protein A